jgi:dUTPase
MSKNVEVEIIMLSDKVTFPMRATSGSAGFDIKQRRILS